MQNSTARNLKHSLSRFLDNNSAKMAMELADSTFKKTKLTSHTIFIGRCLRKRLIPNGFRIRFHPADGDRCNKRLSKITDSCSRPLMQATIHNLKIRLNNISTHKKRASRRVKDKFTPPEYNRAMALISEMNSQEYHEIQSAKDAKFATLLGEATSNVTTVNEASTLEKRTVVTIPEDLPLNNAEYSVLSKGLTFVPVNNKNDEYQVKG